MRLFHALVLTPFAALALSGSAWADDPTDICPDIVIDQQTRNAAYYPGGEPGRNKRDYSHIAVVLTASATCVETRDDQIVATVSVTYAVEPGPLYRGGANVKITAALTKDGVGVLQAGNAKVTQLPQGQAVTVTDTINGLLIGEDDEVEDGGFVLTIGLER